MSPRAAPPARGGAGGEYASGGALVCGRARRPPPRLERPAQHDEPDRPLPVPPPRLEQLDHAVVVDAITGEREPDLVGEVVVAHAHGVGIAERPDARLGARPRPDAGQAREHGVALIAGGCLRRRPLDRRAPSGGPRDRLRLRRFEARAVPRPARDEVPVGRWGEHRARRRPGGALAAPGEDHPPRPERLQAGHLLLEDRARQRVEDEVGTADSQVRMPVVRARDERMPAGIETFGIVAVAAKPRHLIERPLGAGSPRRRAHPCALDAQGERRDALRRAAHSPDHALMLGVGRVVGAALVRRERPPHVDRQPRAEFRLTRWGHRRARVALGRRSGGGRRRGVRPRHPLPRRHAVTLCHRLRHRSSEPWCGCPRVVLGSRLLHHRSDGW